MNLRILVPIFVLFTGLRSNALETPALITLVNGSVQIFSNGSNKPFHGAKGTVFYEGQYYEAKKAKIGAKVFSGSIIHSGPDGKARLVYANGDQINVGPSSSVLLQHEENQNKSKTDISLLYGKLRSVVSKRDKQEDIQFKVKTPTTVAGVRGTDFIVGFNPNSEVGEVSVVRGQVKVADLQEKISEDLKSGQTVEITAPPKETLAQNQTSEKKDESKPTISPLKIKPISQEQLIEYKEIIASIEKAPLEQVSKEDKLAIEKIEVVAQEKTLQGLKIDDPKLYEKLQKNPAKDLQDLDSAVIGEMMKEAPKTKPEVKKTKETIEKVGDEIYRK